MGRVTEHMSYGREGGAQRAGRGARRAGRRGREWDKTHQNQVCVRALPGKTDRRTNRKRGQLGSAPKRKRLGTVLYKQRLKTETAGGGTGALDGTLDWEENIRKACC